MNDKANLAKINRLLAQDLKMGRHKLAQLTGLTENQVRRLLPKADRPREGHPKPEGESSKLELDESRGACSITAFTRINNVEDAIRKSGVDLAIWEVVRSQVTTWEVGMKLNDGDVDRVHVEPLFRVFVEFRRRVPKSIEVAASAYLERLAGKLPQFSARAARPKSAGLLFEASIPDVHFAKLAWAKETGASYDLGIAQDSFRQAYLQLAEQASRHPVSAILLPIGNDFFHVDSDALTTANGTPQDCDGRYAKMVEAGIESVVGAVEELRSIAPVRVIWVPGNHDPRTSWWLVRLVGAHFRGCSDVLVDPSAQARKYVSHGKNLIGFTHGNEEKHADLPNIMATEVPQLWAESTWREWHLGHFHKEKETRHVSADSFGSVVVRVLPSISGTDAWHYRKGYVGGKRAALGHLYDPADGLVAVYHATVR